MSRLKATAHRRGGSAPTGTSTTPTSSHGGLVVRRFPLDTAEFIEFAESRVTRGLTVDECRRFLDPARCG